MAARSVTFSLGGTNPNGNCGGLAIQRMDSAGISHFSLHVSCRPEGVEGAVANWMGMQKIAFAHDVNRILST